MAKILFVDDEVRILDVLKEYAIFNGFDYDFAYNGQEAVDKIISENFDCVVIDIMMPVMDGLTAVKEIKKVKNVPIIIMSAKGEEYDILRGFDLGIDDYIVKPFSPKEVIARIKSVLKRSGVREYLNFGELKIDTEGRNVFIKDEIVKLTNKEYELLLLLVKNKGIVLSREKIMNVVWNGDYDCDVRTVDTHIKMLRQDLKNFSDLIITVRGVGYKFEEK